MNFRLHRLSFQECAAKSVEYAFKHAGTLYAYVSLLYFLEIIYFMIAIAFIYGRAAAVGAGFVLSLLLSAQLLGLAIGKEPFRKIQLFLMEFHAAYSISFIIGALPGFLPVEGVHPVFMLLRVLLTAAEVFGIFLLTDERAKAGFA